MDESFDGYGWQDNDYCRRFEAKGWRTQPTDKVKVIHSGATSFYRKMVEGGEDVQTSCDRMKQLYDQKLAQ
jgi:GT2 family glycosyltransferase